MALDKNFPPIKEEVLDVEAAIDDLLAIQGRPVIYRPTSDLLKLEPKPPFCSFCGKGTNQVDRMMQGNDAHICDQCVMLYSQAILMSREQLKGEH